MSELNVNVKQWYTSEFKSDELGYEIDDKITFEDIFIALDCYKNVYEVFGVVDSVIRERLFEYLAFLMGVDYDYIYEQWLIGGRR